MVISVSFLNGKPERVLQVSATRGLRSVAASAAGGEGRQEPAHTKNRCTWSPPPRDPRRRRPAPPAEPLRGWPAAGGDGEPRPLPDSPRGHRRRCRLGAWCQPTTTAPLGTPLAESRSVRRPARRTDHRGRPPHWCRRPRRPPRRRPDWPCPASADRGPGGSCPPLRPPPPGTARRSLVGRGAGRPQPEPAHRWPGHGYARPVSAAARRRDYAPHLYRIGLGSRGACPSRYGVGLSRSAARSGAGHPVRRSLKTGVLNYHTNICSPPVGTRGLTTNNLPSPCTETHPLWSSPARARARPG